MTDSPAPTEPIVTLYLRVDDRKVYRFKIWETTVWIERQGWNPGANVPFLRSAFPDLYNDAGEWNLRVVIDAMEAYDRQEHDGRIAALYGSGVSDR